MDRLLRWAALAAVVLPSPVFAGDPCADLPRSSIGCEFYAVTLPNPLLDQGLFPFAVSILNPGAIPVQVTITRGASTLVSGQTIAGGALAEFLLPWIPALSTATATAVVADGAYRIVATGPVTVTQLNPHRYTTNGNFSYTGDSSLLLPVHAAGTVYRPAVWPTMRFNAATQLPGFVAVVGLVDGTMVTATPTGPLQAGGGLTTGGGTIVLNAGDVLLAASALDGASDPSYGSELSGTLVTGSSAVLVFAAHAGTYIFTNQGFADHLEEAVPPVTALATEHLVVPPHNTAGTPQHYVKVVATADGTGLTFDPAGVAPATILGAGQVLTFEATVPFRLHSSAAVLVASFLESEANFPGALQTRGDPAQTHVVPVAQASAFYAFFTPATYLENWAHLVAPAGASITVDGLAPDSWNAIGSTGFATARVLLCAQGSPGCTGAHTASGGGSFSLAVHGYAPYTSYAHPAGMDLDPVVLEDSFEWGDTSAWSIAAP